MIQSDESVKMMTILLSTLLPLLCVIIIGGIYIMWKLHAFQEEHKSHHAPGEAYVTTTNVQKLDMVTFQFTLQKLL